MPNVAHAWLGRRSRGGTVPQVASVEAERLVLPRDVADAAVKILAKQRAKPNFGNAGAANNLIKRAQQVHGRCFSGGFHASAPPKKKLKGGMNLIAK